MKSRTNKIILSLFLWILLAFPQVINAQENNYAQERLRAIQQEVINKDYLETSEDVEESNAVDNEEERVKDDQLLEERQEQKDEIVSGTKESGEESEESMNGYPVEFCRKVSLKGDQMELRNILKILSKMAEYNLILDPYFKDIKVNVDFENIEIWRALNSLLFPCSYSFEANGGDLYILGSQTKIFRLSLPPITQKFSDITSNESFSSSEDDEGAQDIKVGTQIYVENGVESLNFWDEIKSGLEILLSKDGKYFLNKPAGVVVVTDVPLNLVKIERYLNEINKKVMQQIAVDVKVVEVSLTDQQKFGVDWNAIIKGLGEMNSLSLATNFATGNFTSGNMFKLTGTGPHNDSGTQSGGVNVVIEALEEQGDVEVVSQPKMVLLNNLVGVIQVGTTKTYVDESKTETLASGGTLTSLSTSQVQEGITMRLMANMVGEDIYLSVSPVVTTIDEIRTITAGSTVLEAPQTTTKSINTAVKVKDGETVAIGGLITSAKGSSEERVPGLSRVPILGGLFKYKEKTNNRTELIIFITPKRIW